MCFCSSQEANEVILDLFLSRQLDQSSVRGQGNPQWFIFFFFFQGHTALQSKLEITIYFLINGFISRIRVTEDHKVQNRHLHRRQIGLDFDTLQQNS